MLRSVGQLHREGGRGAHGDQDRGAGDGGLLHELEGQPPADAENPVGQREQAVERGAADDLVHRVVAPDVLAHDQELALGVEEAGRVQAPGSGEGGLSQPVRQCREQGPGDRRPALHRRRVHRDLLERPLAAHTARRGGVEAPLPGIAEQRALYLDHVRREIVAQPGSVRRADQSLPDQEPDRELLVVAGGSHRHRERLPVDADLERLLDGQLVAFAVADHARDHAGGRRVLRLAHLRRCRPRSAPATSRAPRRPGGRRPRSPCTPGTRC